MSKAIVKDGKTYRMRRGKLVEIPAEWVNKHVYRRTYAAREQAQLGKKERSHNPGRTTPKGGR